MLQGDFGDEAERGQEVEGQACEVFEKATVLILLLRFLPPFVPILPIVPIVRLHLSFIVLLYICIISFIVFSLTTIAIFNNLPFLLFAAF